MGFSNYFFEGEGSLMEGGIWVVAAELGGQGQNAQIADRPKTKHVDSLCQEEGPGVSGHCIQPHVHRQPSSMVMNLHLVAVTYGCETLTCWESRLLF